MPAKSQLGKDKSKVCLVAHAREPLILYPSMQRPSYADQVLSLFHHAGLEPKVKHEARELRIAIGQLRRRRGRRSTPFPCVKSHVDDVR